MQVALATPNATGQFKDASYWFGVVSIVIVLVGAFMILALFVTLFTYNLIITLFFIPGPEVTVERLEMTVSGDRYHDG